MADIENIQDEVVDRFIIEVTNSDTSSDETSDDELAQNSVMHDLQLENKMLDFKPSSLLKCENFLVKN